MNNIIEKLGIKPIEILSEGWKNVVVTIKELKELEQQNREMVEALADIITCYGGSGAMTDIAIEAIQKVAPDKSLTDIQIKELLNE